VLNFYYLIIGQIKVFSKVLDRYISYIVLLVTLYFVIFITGCCIPLSRDRAVDLMDEVSQLHIHCKELQQNYADLSAKVNSDHVTFAASIQDLQNKVSVLSKACSTATGKKSKEDYNEFDSPSSIYGRAYTDYLTKKYELAYSGFKSFIDKYPDDTRVPQARVYMKECLKISGGNMPE